MFCYHNGISTKESTFLTNDGVHHGEVVAPGMVKINIISPLKVAALPNGDFQINTGSPHYIQFTENVDNLNFIQDCQKIRNSKQFLREGINVNMVEETGSEIKLEPMKGVENETLSCGSGVTAAALSYASNKDIDESVKVRTKGGLLTVDFKRQNGHFEDVFLTGPAEFVYRGEINL